MPVYFLKVDGRPEIKIGYSANPAKRLVLLQGAHVDTLRFVRIVEGDPADELKIHARFQHLRIRGEWFRFDPAMMTVGVALPIPALAPTALRGAPMRDEIKRAIRAGVVASYARQRAAKAGLLAATDTASAA